MAGTLREFAMPNPTLAKKRERNADAQEELWEKMGVEPIEIVEGKVEDEAAKAALEMLDKTEKSGDPSDVEKAKSAFIDAAKKAIETKEPAMEEALKKTIEFGQNLLELASSYLTQFVGMVAGRLADRDVRKYYKWGRTSMLDIEGVNTIEDLVRKNFHLGKPILTVLVEQYGVFEPNSKYNVKYESLIPKKKPAPNPVPPAKTKAELIGPLFDSVRDPYNLDLELDRLLQSEQTVGLPTEQKRQWLFSVLDLAAYQFLLGDSCLGAITMALGQIKRIPGCEKFELKQLILSEGVRDIFAIFVAFQYLMSSGGNAYAGRSSQMGNANGTTYMLSAGLETRKMLYAQIETAQYWFRDVYEVENPVKKEMRFRKEKLEKELREAFVPNVYRNGANEDWRDIIGSFRQANSLRATIERCKLVVNDPLFTTYPDQVQDFIRKYLEFFQLEEILPNIIPKVLQHAN